MKIRYKSKLIALAIAGTLSLTGCAENQAKAEVVKLDIPVSTEHEVERVTMRYIKGASTNEKAEPEVKEVSPFDDIEKSYSVKAISNVNIRESANEESEVLGILPKNDMLKYIAEDDNWYEVLYNNKNCYVSKEFSTKVKVSKFKTDLLKVVMLTNDSDLERRDKSIVNIPKYECAEVYRDMGDRYLVQTNDYIGFINKDNTIDLEGTFAIVDISEQDIKVYQDNELLYTAPVVTGKNNRTHIGSFEIHSISKDRYLVGPGYRSYVNYMLKFDGNIGLHDAEYHTDENGRKHGWRSVFGGEEYITNGSHGCVNMPNEAAKFVYENMTYKDKVIVKK